MISYSIAASNKSCFSIAFIRFSNSASFLARSNRSRMALLRVTPSRPQRCPHSSNVKFSDSRTIQAITDRASEACLVFPLAMSCFSLIWYSWQTSSTSLSNTRVWWIRSPACRKAFSAKWSSPKILPSWFPWWNSGRRASSRASSRYRRYKRRASPDRLENWEWIHSVWTQEIFLFPVYTWWLDQK